ncbi:General transcription factor II-I repeat domain-containing protein 2A-like [Oopsacas minuta]|uniref:General transcription factor II-I repeat domain-containing protein 2A-like n=1 Tax=Oopsacas minuta TaxID=111878 RepID=A0AAV7JJE2_9METZ|nr:General transcription factor II-I repeat domain-containing protein 2A-like [Oopsacas minuta]
MSAQMCVIQLNSQYYQRSTKAFEVVEELLDPCPMKGTITGQDILNEVKHVIMKFNLSLGKHCGIRTDGTPVMIGKHKEFTSLMLKYVSHEVITHHCIIRQQQLCAKTLQMKHVMEKVVSTFNIIRSNGLNPREFQAFLTEEGSDHDDVIYCLLAQQSGHSCQIRFPT